MRSIPLAPRILVTGGAGYIGSHTVLELIQAGYAVVVVDNLSNASPASLIRLEELSGEVVPFVRADVRDVAAMTELFQATSFDAVIHFAGLKAVGESVSQPLTYWDNNVQGTLVLLQAMDAAGVRRIVFSSSATVYGDPESVPIVEAARIGPTNPYGRTKAAIETVLSDLAASDARWAASSTKPHSSSCQPARAASAACRLVPAAAVGSTRLAVATHHAAASVYGGRDAAHATAGTGKPLFAAQALSQERSSCDAKCHPDRWRGPLPWVSTRPRG
jgi:hypothetical protein